MKETFERCLQVAAEIVAHYRALVPPGVVVLAFGGGKSKTDTSFSRSGTSRNAASFTLPAALASLVSTNASGSAPGSDLEDSRRRFTQSLLEQSPSDFYGRNQLDEILNLNPAALSNRSSLEAIANRDPFSTDYENDTVEAYRQRAGEALATVQSGHPAVRGGQSRSAISQGVLAERLAKGRGEEVRTAQAQDSKMVTEAVQLLNLMEAARNAQRMTAAGQGAAAERGRQEVGAAAGRSVDASRMSHSAALELASKMLGSQEVATTDNLGGRGMQHSNSFGWSFLRGILG